MVENSVCVACRLEIPQGAQKCTHCGTFQNWRRHFNFSGSVLGLLVALISILTFAVPVFKEAFRPPSANPQIIAVWSESEQIEQSYSRGDEDSALDWVRTRQRGEVRFVVSNSGQVGAVLSNILITVQFVGPRDVQTELDLPLGLNLSERELLLHPGVELFTSVKWLNLERSQQSGWKLRNRLDPTECQLTTLFVHLDGTHELQINSLDCSFADTLIRSIAFVESG